jgi:hypothetical protein
VDVDLVCTVGDDDFLVAAGGGDTRLVVEVAAPDFGLAVSDDDDLPVEAVLWAVVLAVVLDVFADWAELL